MARSRSPAQIQRLALLNLRKLREDRHGGQSGTDLGAGSHCADFAVQPPFGHQQAWAPTAVDEPQPQARAGFPFARGDAVAAGGFAWGPCGDGWPKPAARPAQRPRIMRANDDRGVRPRQCCSAQALAAQGIGSKADRVPEPGAQPCDADQAAPGGLQARARLAYGGSRSRATKRKLQSGA